MLLEDYTRLFLSNGFLCNTKRRPHQTGIPLSLFSDSDDVDLAMESSYYLVYVKCVGKPYLLIE